MCTGVIEIYWREKGGLWQSESKGPACIGVGHIGFVSTITSLGVGQVVIAIVRNRTRELFD